MSRDPWAALRNCAPVWDKAPERDYRKDGTGPRKACRTCKDALLLNEFYTNGDKPGRRADCRRCYTAKVVSRRQLTA